MTARESERERARAREREREREREKERAGKRGRVWGRNADELTMLGDWPLV